MNRHPRHQVACSPPPARAHAATAPDGFMGRKYEGARLAGLWTSLRSFASLPAEGSRMQVKCSKCSGPIALTDITESTDGRRSHVDCVRPSNLTSAERQLIYVYCFDHVVEECLACNATCCWQQLGVDAIAGRTNMCPRCPRDLTDSIRAHLYGNAIAPPEVRRRVREVREAARRLVKESQQLRDTSDVIPIA